MKIIKKIWEHIKKNTFGIIFVLCLDALVVVTSIYSIFTFYRPLSQYEPHEVRLYHPTVKVEYPESFFATGKRLKLIQGEYKFHCLKSSDYKLKNDERLYDSLQLEKYLDIVYIIADESYKVIAVSGADHVYYSVEDYNNYQKEVIVFPIVVIIVYQILLIIFYVLLMKWEKKGCPVREPTRLRKKHPVEKHIYDDEENEFSPYKQKLIEEEREEE